MPQPWEVVRTASPPKPSGVTVQPWEKVRDSTGAPAKPIAPNPLAANPHGEGTYQMVGADGSHIAIPYSNVRSAQDQRFQLRPDDQQRYSKDNAYATPGNALTSGTPLATIHANYADALTPKPGVANNFGRGVTETMVAPIASAIRHPINTVKSIAATLPHLANPFDPQNPIGNSIANTVEDYQQHGAADATAHLLGEGAGAYLGGEVTAGVAGKVLNLAAPALKNLAASTGNFGLGTSVDAYGGNPGMAVAQNKIYRLTPTGIGSKLRDLIPKAADQHLSELEGYTGPPLDLNASVNQPFNDMRADKLDPVTGAASPTKITQLNNTQRALSSEVDPFTGKPITLGPTKITMLRDLTMSPADANTFKSNLYGMTNYSDDINSLSNDALKSAASNVRSQIRDAVPSSAASGDNLHNLMSLDDQLKSVTQPKIPTSKNGLISTAAKMLPRLAAPQIYRMGDLASTASAMGDLFPGVSAGGAAIDPVFASGAVGVSQPLTLQDQTVTPSDPSRGIAKIVLPVIKPQPR